MTIERHWIDWTKPCLESAARRLIDRAGSGDGGLIDLSRVVCVLPVRRAGRILLEMLLEECERRSVRLIPPRMLTPGDLGRRLLDLSGATATPMEQVLAWSAALRQADPESLRPILPQTPPDSGIFAWMEIARLVQSIDDELAGEQVDFEQAASLAEQMDRPAEAQRWQALAAARDLYARELDRANLVDPNRAMREAIDAQRFSIDDGHLVVLIGIVELNRQQRRLIGSLPCDVVAFIHAPPSESARFDHLGCVIPETWAEEGIELDDGRIHVVDRPFDQAQEALRIIAGFDGSRRADEITIGLGDESLQPTMIRAADWAGLPLHAAAGWPLAQSAPLRLLELAAAWLREPRFAHMIELLRHPDIEGRLGREMHSAPEAERGVAHWIMLLEEYFREHLHERIDGTWLGSPEQQDRLRLIHQSIERLFSTFQRGPRSLGEWCGPLLAFLRDVYGEVEFDRSQRGRSIAAIEGLAGLIESLAAAHASLLPEVTADESIGLVVAEARKLAVPPQRGEDEIDLLGWLELHLDPAPVLILCSFNDGCVPGAVFGDAFLPDSLRAALGLIDNERRAARDRYLLKAILHSREEVHVIVGRRGLDDSPLAPSRFLFACDDETVLRRVLATGPDMNTDVGSWLLGSSPRRPANSQQPIAPPVESKFIVPALPSPLPPPQSMRVTDFRLFLRCPYRYALERLVGLEAVDAEAWEMDALAFGSFAHEVLEAFGKNEDIARSTDSEEIERFLCDEVNRRSRERFGEDLLPAVRVQLAHLRQRLHDFAARQAQWRREGWEIRHAELKFDGEVALDLPGDDDPPMPLRGTIDRIDHHPDQNRWRVIDYKTGDSGSSPHEQHHGRKTLPKDAPAEWLDLQLPLYHFLLTRSSIGVNGPIELGYIVLPTQSGGTDFLPATWDEEQLEDAVNLARRIVGDIRAGRFQPADDFIGLFDPFARICQTMVLGAIRRAVDEGDR